MKTFNELEKLLPVRVEIEGFPCYLKLEAHVSGDERYVSYKSLSFDNINYKVWTTWAGTWEEAMQKMYDKLVHAKLVEGV